MTTPSYHETKDDYESDADNEPDFEAELERDYDEGRDFDCDFADPGGRSALRAATDDDPRDQPCPSCKSPDRLTSRDVRHGYQCDSCADACERGGY